MLKALIEQIERKMIGKHAQVERVVMALIAGGHILIEDVPGVGKTTLAKALAESIDGTFNRVQFTSDLMPADIFGMNIFLAKEGRFELRRGPIFTNVLLADEINRSSPKTQSALLEAMAEGQVTIDGVAYPLVAPFMVIATQNPVEYQGTFPLLESQLDRFMMRIEVGYPSAEQESSILDLDERLPLAPVMSCDEIRETVRAVAAVYVEPSLKEYILSIAAAIRADERVKLAISPRATKDLYRAAKARAYLRERDFVLPEDIQHLAVDVLAHRLLLKEEVRYRGLTECQLVTETMKRIAVPRVKRP
jgi:MoxR-like ATPase